MSLLPYSFNPLAALELDEALAASESEGLRILAFAHQAQQPFYWLARR